MKRGVAPSAVVNSISEWRSLGTPRNGRSLSVGPERKAAGRGGGGGAAMRTPRDGATPRCGASETLLLREGSLVQLEGLEGVCGLKLHGCYDASLGEYNGRKGRVSRDPPPWVIKAHTPEASASGALVPVLLDSRSTDRDRGQGVWVAVPPENLRVVG